jgi:murein DD-endopeptidase MepM/ murein hydrolase activator NlpD
MGYSSGPNSFPVFLRAQQDGSTTAEIRRFEDFVSGAGSRIGRSFATAAEQADKAFNFTAARKAIDDIEREVQRLGKLQNQKIGDPFGVAGGLANLRNSPLQRMLNDQASAEASLDNQRRRSHAERMQAIQSEFDAAIGAIRERRAADLAAINDIIARENSLVALEQQRVAGQAALVAGRTFIQAPAFDPAGAQQSAAAAASHASALNQLALAAEKVAAAESGATATDRAYANTLRASATAASEEATRLQALAATQTRVATAAAGLNKANLELGSSTRASRFATLQASQQFQDFFIQIGAGTNPVVAFTQQASQLAFVMSAAGGTAGKLAKFMAGGGGTVAFALLAVIPLVATLIGKLSDQNDEVDKAIAKESKEAQQTAANAKAHDYWKNSIEGVIDAIRRQNDELDKALTTQAATQRLAVQSAENNLRGVHEELDRVNREFANLGGTGKITQLQGQIAKLRNTGAHGETAPEATQLQQQLDKLQATQARITELQGQIKAGGDAVVKAQLVLAQSEGKAIADLSAKANQWYQLYTDALSGVPKGKADAGGILFRHPNLQKFAAQINASVEKVFASAQHAASAGAPFDTFLEKAKQLGVELDKGKIAPLKYADAMDKLAASLEGVAKAAEEAKRNQGKVFSDFQLPVQGRITGRFGEQRPGHTHAGVDIAVPVGTDVKAAAAGTVIEVGSIPGYGNVVVINHGNGTMTRYAHLSKFLTQKGATVGQGDVIALSGGAKGAEGAGNSQGPHVHYEVTVGGKPVNPLKARFPTDEFAAQDRAAKIQQQTQEQAERAAQAAATAQERLGNASESYDERVQRINEQWNEQPKLIDQAAQAHRELLHTIEQARQTQADYNALIAKLQKEKPPGYEDTVKQLEASRHALDGVIAAAQEAGPVIDQGVRKPLDDIVKAERLASAQAQLTLSGHADLAEALGRISELKDRIGKVDAQDAATILRIVEAERARQLALQQQERLIGRAVQSARVLQDALTGVIAKPFDLKSYKTGLKSIMDDFRQNFARSISESLLGGDLGDQMEQALRAKSDPLGQAGADLTSSAGDLTSAAQSLTEAANSMSASAGPSVGAVAATPTAFPGGGGGLGGVPTFFSRIFGQLNQSSGATAGATATLTTIQQHQSDMLKRSALLSSPEQYYNLLGANVGKSLDKALGTGGFFGKIGGKLGTALEGAQLGQMSGQLVKALGLKSSSTGSALGGAAGMLIAGPVGAIIGGLLGGIVGGLFKKKKSGGATIGPDDTGSLGVTTFGNDNRAQAGSHAANNLLDTLDSIAQQFGVALDASKGAVSIGVRGSDYRVDPSGSGRTKGSGVVNFSEDEQAAIEFAIKNLIEDGVLGPIKDGAKKLLLESRDLQTGLTKALKFNNVFKELKTYTDPVGAAIDDLDQQFAELRRIFAEAGASAQEYAQLEQLYAFKRNDAIKAATAQLDQTLTQLLKDLQYRGDTGLSLRTRETRAKADLAPFQQKIGAGQTIDQEEFANVVNSFLDIERQMYGSTKQYFDALNLVTSLTQKAIANANSGGTVATPAITAITAPGTTATPVTYANPTGSASGTPISNTPLVAQAAANDNAASASSIVAAIEKQTQDLIKAGLDFNQMVQAIETAFLNLHTTELSSGGQGVALKPLIDQIGVGNNAIVGKLSDILKASQDGNDKLSAIGGTSFGAVDKDSYTNRDLFPQGALFLSGWRG